MSQRVRLATGTHTSADEWARPQSASRASECQRVHAIGAHVARGGIIAFQSSKSIIERTTSIGQIQSFTLLIRLDFGCLSRIGQFSYTRYSSMREMVALDGH
ncbi:MAG: hypothetical protein B7Y35_09555 [Sphingomonadales bacterium 28-64-96]|nr:MAG: hypothetical protein B7Y35_09555 [Sphingomonadales bacterium 28-64-96]